MSIDVTQKYLGEALSAWEDTGLNREMSRNQSRRLISALVQAAAAQMLDQSNPPCPRCGCLFNSLEWGNRRRLCDSCQTPVKIVR